jgi:hypothetical protein
VQDSEYVLAFAKQLTPEKAEPPAFRNAKQYFTGSGLKSVVCPKTKNPPPISR